MTTTHELPPMLRGTEQQQLTALRDYLVRLAQSLNAVDGATAVSPSADTKAVRKQAEDLRQQAVDLRSLIIKTADALDVKIENNSTGIDELTGAVTSMQNTFVTSEQFGSYTESVSSAITNTARAEIAAYDYTSVVNGIVGGDIDLLKSFATLLNGEIRRGVLYDPSLQEDVLGIAISQNMEFYENDPLHPPTEDGGLTYYRIRSQQTFGFYTSCGWQFYVNGQKVGWFDSMNAEAALHVASLITETSMRFGGDWIIDRSGSGIGLRYIGS